jgi:hypothetical protein
MPACPSSQSLSASTLEDAPSPSALTTSKLSHPVEVDHDRLPGVQPPSAAEPHMDAGEAAAEGASQPVRDVPRTPTCAAATASPGPTWPTRSWPAWMTRTRSRQRSPSRNERIGAAGSPPLCFHLAGLRGLGHQHRHSHERGGASRDRPHDMHQVERSFRMVNSDLAARPMFGLCRPWWRRWG